MEFPNIGKRANMFNRRGIVALFNRNEEDAMRFWSKGLEINDRHFNCKTNFVLFRWSTAKINEQKMIEELQDFVFLD
jgi:hypothetical protein